MFKIGDKLKFSGPKQFDPEYSDMSYTYEEGSSTNTKEKFLNFVNYLLDLCDDGVYLLNLYQDLGFGDSGPGSALIYISNKHISTSETPNTRISDSTDSDYIVYLNEIYAYKNDFSARFYRGNNDTSIRINRNGTEGFDEGCAVSIEYIIRIA